MSGVLFVSILATSAPAQALGFGDFSWTFAGLPGSSGTVSPDLMHIQGPDNVNCNNGKAVFTTTAPWAGTVRVVIDWKNPDPNCLFDWPIYIQNGQVVEVPLNGQFCFLDGLYYVEFDVQAGATFGLGVESKD